MFSLKKSLLGLLGLLALVGALATLMPLVSRGQGNNPIVEQLRPRRFYLTQIKHSGGQALSACAAGYHMASLWEIFDTSNLRYNTELGFTQEDSGFGPPNVFTPGPPQVDRPFGWVRTGGRSASGSAPGLANCNAWTSADGDLTGTVIFLSDSWDSGDVTIISPWRSFTSACDSTFRVWCVQD
jgi:hypothetical protein